MKDSYKKSVLNNGVTIITDNEPSFYSAALGIWVKNGARDEEESNNGISHFIEHMLFKGTDKRSALDIAKEIDSVGGTLNAFTTRETTCYYVKVLENNLQMASELLLDIFLNSIFDETELEREKQVILQEIKMVEDTPDDYIYDIFGETFWGDFPLGRPVIGNVKNVSTFTKSDLNHFMEENYSPEKIIISAAGNVEHDRLVKIFESTFSNLKSACPKDDSQPSPKYSSNRILLRKKLEQVHICLGMKGISSSSSKRHAAYILNTYLGGGMSSRLFQEVREKRGLAYSIYSYLSSYRDAGLVGIYAGTAAESFSQVIDLIVTELKSLKERSISESELSSAKEQLKGGIILGLESSDSRMQKLAGSEITFGRDIPLEETIENIDAVTSDDVLDLAGELLTADSLNIAVLGDIKKKELDNKMDELRARL